MLKRLILNTSYDKVSPRSWASYVAAALDEVLGSVKENPTAPTTS